LFNIPVIPGFENYLAYNRTKNVQEIKTQEVRLTSNGQARLRWSAGAFYQQARAKQIQSVADPQFDSVWALFTGMSVPQTFGEADLPGTAAFLDGQFYPQGAIAALAATPSFADEVKWRDWGDDLVAQGVGLHRDRG